jgi:small GTP-binding protein
MIQKKVCMLGAFAVGKTSLVARFVSSIYSETYHTTVGVKVDSKEVSVGGVPVNLVLWDMQGEDELQKVKLVYLRGAAGYLLVVDGTRGFTLDMAEGLQRKITETIGAVPFVLVLNKSDLEDDWELEPARIEALRKKGWSVNKSSARTGSGVQESFSLLAAMIMRGKNG